MSTAKRLPSGSYRALAYAGKDEDGKRKYKSFTAPTKKEAELLAAQWQVMEKKKGREAQDQTVEEALMQYIDARDGVLSPATIRQYKSKAKSMFPSLLPMKISSLTEQAIQTAISAEAKKLAPKTVMDRYGFLKSALGKTPPILIA